MTRKVCGLALTFGQRSPIKSISSIPLSAPARGDSCGFFSFLAWYSRLKTTAQQRIILLLDEPGLSLHAKAQEDLLRYFEEELKEDHQLIYSTHSPFMVDPKHFERVRIVQDKTIDSDDELPPEQEGTKVLVDVLDAGPDSLFPLQGALGYEIYQALFIGPNSVVVEGASDLLYIQMLSSILMERGREGSTRVGLLLRSGGPTKFPPSSPLSAHRSRCGLLR